MKEKSAARPRMGSLPCYLPGWPVPFFPPFFKTDHGTNHQTTGKAHSLVAHTLRPFHFSTWNVLSVPRTRRLARAAAACTRAASRDRGPRSVAL
jgi:hypothetical protein